ncbi:hypothetical protein HK104_003066 [Borealophlyctis nickersoniae]|nr:hypothetical protein HK104_003066 [Borealophlyctis nickersoniae]
MANHGTTPPSSISTWSSGCTRNWAIALTATPRAPQTLTILANKSSPALIALDTELESQLDSKLDQVADKVTAKVTGDVKQEIALAKRVGKQKIGAVKEEDEIDVNAVGFARRPYSAVPRPSYPSAAPPTNELAMFDRIGRGRRKRNVEFQPQSSNYGQQQLTQYPHQSQDLRGQIDMRGRCRQSYKTGHFENSPLCEFYVPQCPCGEDHPPSTLCKAGYFMGKRIDATMQEELIKAGLSRRVLRKRDTDVSPHPPVATEEKRKRKQEKRGTGKVLGDVVKDAVRDMLAVKKVEQMGDARMHGGDLLRICGITTGIEIRSSISLAGVELPVIQ